MKAQPRKNSKVHFRSTVMIVLFVKSNRTKNIKGIWLVLCLNIYIVLKPWLADIRRRKHGIIQIYFSSLPLYTKGDDRYIYMKLVDLYEDMKEAKEYNEQCK